MDPDGRLVELVLECSSDPEWLPAVSRDITDAVHAAFPDFNLNPDLRDETFACTESILRQFVYMVRNQVSPADAELPPVAAEYARDFVQQGIPLGSLLLAVQIGHAAFFRSMAELSRRTFGDGKEHAEAIELGAEWTFSHVGTLSSQMVTHFAEERDRWVRSAAAIRSGIVDQLLSGAPIDTTSASRKLNYDLARTHLAFVVWTNQDQADGAEMLAMIERAALQFTDSSLSTKPLLVSRGRRLVAGWGKWSGSIPMSEDPVLNPLDPELFPLVFVACGSPGHGVEGFGRSHREALQARRVAKLRRSQPGAITRYQDVALAALASADPDQARSFVAAELGTLAAESDRAALLRGTLLVYLEENLSPRRAAARIGVHENTISNRIQAIQDQLPVPIEKRACELEVALNLMTVVPAPTE
jgi:hypothetical protein